MLHRFFQYLQSEKRYSAHTVRAYESDLRQMVAYMAFDENELHHVTHRHLRGWLSSLIEQGLNTRSVNRKISSVSAFYTYLVRQGQLAQNPVEKVVNPKNSKRLPFFYKKEQLNDLLDTPQECDTYEAQRNHAMLELLYGTGMRLSELVGLRVGSVDLAAQTVRVLGKGSKQRIIPLSPRLCDELKQYTQVLKNSFDWQPDSAFFRTAKGVPIYPGLVYRVVHGSLAAQGVRGKKSPHVLRHSFATHMLTNGADLSCIKDLLGHASLSATQVYTHNDVEKLLKSYHRAHPHAE